MDGKHWSKISAFDLVVIAVLAAIKAYLLGKYGVHSWQDNDGIGYIAIAEQLIEGTAWTSVPDAAIPLPLTLLRLAGYPALIAAAKLLAGQNWVGIIIGLQLIASLLASYVLYRVASAVSGFRVFGFACAAVFALSCQAYYERFVLTDSLYASLFTMAVAYAAWLVHARRSPSGLGIAFLGLSLAVMFLFREMTVAIAAGAVPLLALAVWPRRGMTPWRRSLVLVRSLVLIFLPLLAAIAAILAWNTVRVGQPVITAGAAYGFPVALMRAEIAGGKPFMRDSILFELAPKPLQDAVAKLETASGKIFTKDTLLDELARKHFKTYYFTDVEAIIGELRGGHGLSLFEIQRQTTKRYIEAWLDRPDLMLKYVVSGFEEARYVLHSPFVVEALALPGPVWRHPYVRYQANLFDICLLLVPLFWLAAAVLVKAARPTFYLCGALALIAAATTFGYAAISMDVRYVLPTIAPILLIVAASVSAAVELAKWAARQAAGLVGMRAVPGQAR